jgi:hypothetical protein
VVTNHQHDLMSGKSEGGGQQAFSDRARVGTVEDMVLLLVLLIVLIFAGAGFAVHLLWIAAVIFALFWLVGAALGRGETAGRHKFYRW